MSLYKVLAFDSTNIRNIIPGSTDTLSVPSSLTVDGNLTVNGTTTSINSEIKTSDRYLVMNSAYTADTVQNGGIVWVTDPASTTYSVDNTVTQSTTIQIPSTNVTGVISANDILLISSAEDDANNGIVEVHSVAFAGGNSTITIKDASTNTPTAAVDGAVITALVANADDDTITVTKVKIGILQTDSANNKMKVAFGDDAAALSFANLLMSTDSITASAIAADDITAGDAAVTVQTSSGNVKIDSNAGTAIIDGHTGVTIDASNSGDITLDSNAGSVTISNHNGSSVGLKLGSTLVTSSAAELNLLDGSSAGTIVNSKVLVYGSSGEVNATTLQIAGTSITSTAAELNILDGVTSTTAELNILDGVTSTTAELNILDGVTSTTAELNLLDGVTSTTAELNYVDVTAGTATASKAVVLDANKDIAGIQNLSMTSGTDSKPQLTIENTNNNANGASIVLKKNPTGGAGTIADSDIVGVLDFESIDDGGNATTFAKIQAKATDVSDAAEKGGIEFQAYSNISGSYALGTMLDIGVTTANTITVADGTLNLNIASHDGTSGLALGGVVVTASAAELNLLDGVTSTTAELNILDGVTSTAAELNLVDGSSAGTIVNSKAVVYGSSGEVNATTLQIAGSSITSTAAELNLLDGSSAGSVVNSKAVVYGGSGEVAATTITLGGVAISSTAAELNILDGVTSTAAELNILDGVTSTAAELNILDGVTATAAELNYVDVTTAGTAQASKALVADSNVDISGIRNVEAVKIQRSGATLDIEGGTGINFKENGITVASIDTSRNYDVDSNSLTGSAAGGAGTDLYLGKLMTSGEAFNAGMIIRLHTDGKAYKAANDDYASSKIFGVAMQAASGADESKRIATMKGSIIDMEFSAAPASSKAGSAVYLDTSSADGKVNITAPTSNVVMKIGVLVEDGDGSTTLRKVLFQPEHVVTYG